MPQLKFEEVLKELNKKIYRPVYFLMGKEPYFIDKITEFIEENILSPSEKDFNLSVFYGKDSKIEDIIAAARRYPLMSDYQVVILKEAQQIKSIEKLEKYVENPLKSTILVINYKNGSYDKRKKFYKIINNNFLVFESPEIKEYKIGSFIKSYVKSKGYEIDEKAVNMLVEFLGNSVSTITNEIDKLIILLDTTKKITPEDIEKNIGISKDYNVFELINAIGEKDFYKAQLIANYFAKNSKSHPLIFTVQMIYQYFIKLLTIYDLKKKNYTKNQIAKKLGINIYFYDNYEKSLKSYNISQIVKNLEIIQKYDLYSKGVGIATIEESELLKELLFRIMI